MRRAPEATKRRAPEGAGWRMGSSILPHWTASGGPMASLDDRIKAFMAAGPWAVVGASSDREKYGNKVLRAYQQRGMEVHPVNPRGTEIEGLKAYPTVAAVPGKVQSISVITPPKITEQVVKDAAAAGVKHIW